MGFIHIFLENTDKFLCHLLGVPFQVFDKQRVKRATTYTVSRVAKALLHVSSFFLQTKRIGKEYRRLFGKQVDER